MSDPARESEADRAARYRRVRDREPLETLETGLIVVRCFKHEPLRDPSAYSAEELKKLTDQVRGSRFFAHWTLVKYADWSIERVTALGWN